MTTLPRFVVLYSESVEKYANFSTDEPIQVNGKQAWSPRSRFEVRQSTRHPTMVHLRSSYNNKFLQLGQDDDFIYPSSINPIEDQTKTTSTLFIPEFSSGETFSLLHVQRGLYVTTYDNVPTHLAFKGDNGSYLGLVSGAAMRFKIDDKANKTIVHELAALPDGTVRIKNTSEGAFWRLNPDDYIFADDLTTTNTPPTRGSVFQPYQVKTKVIALRNMGNQLYCKNNSFSAKDSEITGYARLELTELVSFRMIHDFIFDITNGWVDNKTEHEILNGEGQVVTNETDQTRIIDAMIYYKDTKTSSTWTSANSPLKLGPTVTIQPDQIPVITDSSEIAKSDPFQKSYVWGETTTQNSDRYKHHSVTLPPWTMVTVQLKASFAICHVPLAYTRHDILDETTGQQPETHTMDDGEYKGTNYFNFTFHDSEPKPITKKKN
ncbi:hypothetical protein LINPERHAP2_LOCUS3464 [Linum perenne]